MLATFVIGLREGLEAALIVGIIAAFLKQSGRPDALRKMWLGVVVAVLLCLAVGVVLQSVNSSLPQRQQEMLECIVAGIAVVMVSYMVLWMRKHSRSLKSDLQTAAGGALAAGSATALVVMAFLAVFREGFETAVFLLAAFQSAVSPTLAAAGALLGIVIAVGLGYLIYRGGVRLNLSRFFRITGVVLVFVAAGLVMSTLRAAYEAGWLVVGQQHAVSLTVIARPGTVQESLLTGVLGIRSSMPVIEVVAYFLYLIPMLAVVLWPAKRALTGRRLGQVLVGTAAVALVLAAGLFAFAPAAPQASTATLQVRSSTTGTDPDTGNALTDSTNGSVKVAIDANDGHAKLERCAVGRCCPAAVRFDHSGRCFAGAVHRFGGRHAGRRDRRPAGHVDPETACGTEQRPASRRIVDQRQLSRVGHRHLHGCGDPDGDHRSGDWHGGRSQGHHRPVARGEKRCRTDVSSWNGDHRRDRGHRPVGQGSARGRRRHHLEPRRSRSPR